MAIITPSVLVKKELASRQLILNRPRRLNAIDMEMVDIIYPHLKSWELSDSQAKVIFMKGLGRALCAGGDVKDLIKKVKDPSKHDDLGHQLDTEYEMIHFIATMKKPYISVMDGIAMGAGGGLLSGLAPFRIATENTQFAMPETAIGLFCDVGASFFLSRLDGNLGQYIGMSSRIVKAEDALFSGLATHFVPSSRLAALEAKLSEIEFISHDKVHEIIEEFAVKKDHKPSVYTLYGDTLKTINNCFKYEHAEKIIEALEKDGSHFAKETVETILKRSPTSVKITLEHIRQGSKLSLKECLKMEHRLWQTVPFAHDFVEGVTSHVVHKQIPKWNPKRLEDADIDDIRVKFFYANVKRQLNFMNSRDFHHFPYARYGLPTEEEILEVRSKYNLTSVQDTVAWFQENRKDKYGVREKVEDVLYRREA
ncbi:hypothetical protein G6F46_005755 [Rhizopus delemar]|nr:hypothetical protein G6F55_003790 [Rhizopus delemar]KAG1544853.1 hypothetical protein G6F51_005811 [Rhizopus arrhizus]KAG1498493.1 hypothetical protein G6F54_005047 [Rhizopus delemar]KAG1512225.1 hypothetical protein G6F53_005343 [Rhizopus delemar]KAG1527090.1 hypothetical protein G6F52_001846 [Rhizopus delemar]